MCAARQTRPNPKSVPRSSASPSTLTQRDLQGLEILRARLPSQTLAGPTAAAAEISKPPPGTDPLCQRYVQYRDAKYVGIIGLDLDKVHRGAKLGLRVGQAHPGGLNLLADLAMTAGIKLPLPNWETKRQGGNYQIFFVLRFPVLLLSKKPTKASRLLQAVITRLKYWYQADPASNGRVLRGLLHPDQRSVCYRTKPYTLSQLIKMLPPAPRERRLTFGVDRNDSVFRALDNFGADLAVTVPATSPEFASQVRIKAQELRKELGVDRRKLHPYTTSETQRSIRSVISRSISGKNSKYRTSERRAPYKRSSAWSTNRLPLKPAEAHRRVCQGSQIANAKRAADAQERYLEAARRLQQRGEVINAASMAREAGVSERTARAHASVWRAVASDDC